MKPYLTLVTLGVRNLEKSLAFYRDGLGWPAKPQGDVVFIPLQNGVVLSLYGRDDLATDAEVSSEGSGFTGFTLAHNVGSAEEVNTIFNAVEDIGARIVKSPKKAEWGGYSGYFSDPDGYLWEVAHNPFWKLNEDGSAEVS